MKNGEITLAVAADYSKAFDTIKHEKLLHILHNLGMSMSAVDLVHSYLSGRTQFVQIDDHKSARGNVTFGVPQGSILGPVLLNLYVCDLSKNTTNPNVQYADDTTCYTHCKVEKIKEAKQTIEKDLDTINDWSAERNLNTAYDSQTWARKD